jgi:microcystin-dependent protein
MIMLWSGAIVSIPTGWLLCDGTNSTPDLRSKFVTGAGTLAVNDTGGSADLVVPSHTHTATDSGHTHTQTGYTSAIPQNNGSNQFPVITPISLTTGTGFANITVATTGVSPTNANLPPYLALAYIMKS